MSIWIETEFITLVLHSRKYKKSILCLHLYKQNYIKISENQVTSLKSDVVHKMS